MKSLSRVWRFATPWTVAYQAPPSMGFSRQQCEWFASSIFRGFSQSRDQTRVSRVGGRRFNLWATREALYLRLLIFLPAILIPACASSSLAFSTMYSAYLEKEMAIHSSTLAWKIPWTEEPDRLQSMGSQRVGHDWVTSVYFTSLHSAYKLNKQGDKMQPWCTPFHIWNQSVVPCPVLTVASWPAYRFLKRKVR